MPFFIDAHEDLAYNALNFGRNILRSASETRQVEINTPNPERNGQAMLGWEDYQRGKVALVIGSLFISPARYQAGAWESQVYHNLDEASKLLHDQVDFYNRLCDQNPEKFRLVRTRKDLSEVLAPWKQEAAKPNGKSHPVGLVMSMEGAEGIHHPADLEEWWELGVRLLGPVWAGGRFCGGMYEPGSFTSEGRELLEVMADLGYTLDLSHMNEVSALQALDEYQGAVISSHSNVRSLIRGAQGERHFSDIEIRRLVEHSGIMGVVFYNRYINAEWTASDPRQNVTLEMLAAHIDVICQTAGNSLHAGIGTDFDGGFGWPSVPYEMNSIADLPKLAGILEKKGYTADDVASITGANWMRLLERTLP